MSLTYIPNETTCQVGQREPCGQPAVWMIAITAVVDDWQGCNPRDGGIVFLCHQHSHVAVSEWSK